MSGRIPLDIGDVTELREIKIDASSLAGNLPDSMSKLTKLVKIEIWTSLNQEVTTLPTVLREMKSLRYLELWENTMTGGLPDWICELTWITDNLWYAIFPPNQQGLA